MKPVVRTYISASMFTHMRNLSLCQKLQQHRQNDSDQYKMQNTKYTNT